MFKPMLAPNNKEPLKLEDLNYPLMASYKLNGIRCEFINGEIKSRSLKPIQNKQLREKFEKLAEYTSHQNVILDGEIYSPEIPFPLISSCVMTQDYSDKKSIKAWAVKCEEHGIDITREEVIKTINFHAFDCVVKGVLKEPFKNRSKLVNQVAKRLDHMIAIKQVIVNSKQEVEELYKQALGEGLEGLILKDINGRYKCGRGTIKEGLIFKVKPLETVDAKIIEVIQGTNVKEGVAKKINELGRSVTSKKKDDRELNGMVSDFRVNYKDTTVKVSCSRMKHPERKRVWDNKESYIGKMIEYCFIPVDLKDKPISPRFVKFREDKDE